MLNRTLAPVSQSIKSFSLIQPESIKYGNGLQAFVFQEPNLDLIKFEFVFTNVYGEVEKPLLNTILSAMLKEGTTQLTSAQIADQIDFYGAYLMPEYSFDHTALTIYTMHKYVDKVLPIVSDILQNSIFPQQELETIVRNNKQTLQISLQKNDFVARRTFYKNMFGDNRYGTVSTEESYDSITREELLKLYKKQIQPNNCTLFIAGNVNQQVLNTVHDLFGSSWESTSEFAINDLLQVNEQEHQLFVENRPDALQSAIRLGGISINRKHSDFPALQFVNTLFGGFFGSRLMRNIREDKGYTYSIGSAVANLKHTGFFTLASEVGVDVTKATLTEIEKEFTAIRQEKATQEEIDLVRSYMQGVTLGSLESIFSHLDKFKAVYFSNLDYSYYDHYSNVLSDMTTDRVQDIAIQYLDYDKLVKVIVGKLD